MARDKELMRERFVDFRNGDSGTLVAEHSSAEEGYIYVEFYPEFTIWTLYKIFLPFLMKTKTSKPFMKDYLFRHTFPSDQGSDNNPNWAMIVPPDSKFIQRYHEEMQYDIERYRKEAERARAAEANVRQEQSDQGSKKKETPERGSEHPSTPFPQDWRMR